MFSSSSDALTLLLCTYNYVYLVGIVSMHNFMLYVSDSTYMF